MNAFAVTQAVTLSANYIAQNCSAEQVAVLSVFFTQLGDTLTTITVVNEICENASSTSGQQAEKQESQK